MCCQNSVCPVCDWLSARQRSQSSFLNWMSRGWVNDDTWWHTTSWVMKVKISFLIIPHKFKMAVFLIFVCVTLSLCVSLQLSQKHKVGILLCRAGQSTEEEMYNNEEATPAFTAFLELLGETVCLRGFNKYAAQLDTKSEQGFLCLLHVS